LYSAGVNTRCRIAGLLVVLGLATAVMGCQDESGYNPLYVTNSTSGPVKVTLLHPDTGFEYVMEADIEPGATSWTRSDVYPGARCSDRGTLVARDPRGKEVARRTGRICQGDTWVIESH